jgi:hypothetical protein
MDERAPARDHLDDSDILRWYRMYGQVYARLAQHAETAALPSPCYWPTYRRLLWRWRDRGTAVE